MSRITYKDKTGLYKDYDERQPGRPSLMIYTNTILSAMAYFTNEELGELLRAVFMYDIFEVDPESVTSETQAAFYERFREEANQHLKQYRKAIHSAYVE